jgi:YVTN family beta-propeller protein
VIRQRHFIAVVGAFLIAIAVVGCANAQGNIDDERGGERGAHEETTAPKGDRPRAETAQESDGLDVKVVSPGQAYVPAGFGEGSLWATDLFTCNDMIGPSVSAAASADSAAAFVAAGCKLPQNMRLKRLDPRTGEEVAEILLKGFFAESVEAAFGAGSVWVSSADDYLPNDVVLRFDPQTNRVVDRIPVYSSSGLAFGHGSVWVASASHGIVSRIDSQTGEVVANIDVQGAPLGIAVDESSGAVWVANKRLMRVDPETNRVVAEIPIPKDAMPSGVDSVAVGEGAVWVSSNDKLVKVDPETNEVASMVSVGAHNAQVVFYGGRVWAMGQARIRREHPKPGWSKWIPAFRLVRVDPSTMDVVASEYLTPFDSIAPGALAAGDTCGSQAGRGWLGSRRDSPKSPHGCGRSLPCRVHRSSHGGWLCRDALGSPAEGGASPY